MDDKPDSTPTNDPSDGFPYASFKEYFLAQGHTLEEFEEHQRNRGNGPMTTYVYSASGDVIEVRHDPHPPD
jgi:hypothetical protein